MKFEGEKIINTKKEFGNREELKMLLNQKIDGKVQIIQGVWQFVKDNRFLNPGEFEKKINEFRDEMFSCFDDDFESEYSRYREKLFDYIETKEALAKRGGEIHRQFVDKYGEEYNHHEYFLYSRNDNELTEIQKEFIKLDKEIEETHNDDIAFFYKLDQFFENIYYKKEEVFNLQNLYNENQEAFWKELPEYMMSEFNDVERGEIVVVFSGHCINLVIPDNLYEKLSKRGHAYHLGGTVFNFINKSINSPYVVEHEENHNLSDSFTDNVVYEDTFMEIIKDSVDYINEITENKSPENIIEIEINRLNKEITDYFYHNFTELIADIEQSPRNNIANYFEYITSSINSLHEYLNEISNEIIKNNVSSSLEILENKFIDHVKKLADMFFVTETTGNIDNLRAALILFGARDVDKVERYIKEKVGKDYYFLLKSIRSVGRVDKAYFNSIVLDDDRKESNGERSDEIIKRLNKEDESFFEIENLKKVTTVLEDFESQGRNKEIELISSLISDGKMLYNIGASKVVQKTKNIDDLLEWNRLVNIIAEKTKITELKNRLEDFYIDTQVLDLCKKAAINSNCTALRDFWQKWPFSKKVVAETLVHFLQDGLLEYFSKKNKDGSDIKIIETDYYKFMEEISTDKDVLEALRSAREKNVQ